MSTWGIAVISLSLLLIAYHTWYLGIPLLILGIIVTVRGRYKDKQLKKTTEEKTKKENLSKNEDLKK